MYLQSHIQRPNYAFCHPANKKYNIRLFSVVLCELIFYNQNSPRPQMLLVNLINIAAVLTSKKHLS